MGQPKILLVDDDDAAGEVAERLRDMGCSVVTRSVGIGTAAAILREQPDLVLWDVTMPLVSELDVAAARANPLLPVVSLIVYARRSRAELTALAGACGADGFVEKSDDPREVVRQVERWLPRARSRRPKPRSGTERRARYVVLAGDQATHRALLDAVGPDTVVRHTDSGLEALRWMCSGDPPDLVLAGTSLTDLPAEELARRACEISPRWSERLVVVDEVAGDGDDASPSSPRRGRIEALLAFLDDLRDTA